MHRSRQQEKKQKALLFGFFFFSPPDYFDGAQGGKYVGMNSWSQKLGPDGGSAFTPRFNSLHRKSCRRVVASVTFRTFSGLQRRSPTCMGTDGPHNSSARTVHPSETTPNHTACTAARISEEGAFTYRRGARPRARHEVGGIDELGPVLCWCGQKQEKAGSRRHAAEHTRTRGGGGGGKTSQQDSNTRRTATPPRGANSAAGNEQTSARTNSMRERTRGTPLHP